MIKKLLLVLLLFSCKKEGITHLTGDWTQTISLPQGTMVSILHFSDDQRYSLGSYILSPDKNIITQARTAGGRYGVKSSGITFRTDGQTFDWGIEGWVRDRSLTVKDALDKNKLTFIKL